MDREEKLAAVGTPTFDRLLVELDPATKLSSIVETPDSSQAPSQLATVLKVGPACSWAEPGMRLVVTKFGGELISIGEPREGEPLWKIMTRGDVYAIVDEEGSGNAAG